MGMEIVLYKRNDLIQIADWGCCVINCAFLGGGSVLSSHMEMFRPSGRDQN